MIKTKQRLIIFGSSWLVGVWHCTGPGQVSIQHPGVAKILKSTFHTVNNSVAGSGPFQVLYGIRHYLGTFLNKDDAGTKKEFFDNIKLQQEFAR